MNRTKIVSVLTFVGAVISMAKDALDGGGFSLQAHAIEIAAAAGSAGLFFLRDAIERIETALGIKK